jgi:hypothetical protein
MAGRKNPAALAGTVRPVAKKVEVKKSKSELRITTDVSDDIGDSIFVTARKGNSEFEFSLEVNDVPFCCGIKEVGSFEIETQSSTITAAEKAQAVRQLLTELLEEHTHGARCQTLIFTLIDSQPCNIVRAALVGSNLFTHVKTFSNSNTSRSNDLYVSNN